MEGQVQEGVWGDRNHGEPQPGPAGECLARPCGWTLPGPQLEEWGELHNRFTFVGSCPSYHEDLCLETQITAASWCFPWHIMCDLHFIYFHSSILPVFATTVRVTEVQCGQVTPFFSCFLFVGPVEYNTQLINATQRHQLDVIKVFRSNRVKPELVMPTAFVKNKKQEQPRY